jgi:hypothetical protein
VDEEDILWIDLIHLGPLVPNLLGKQVATTCKLKNSLGQSLKHTQATLGFTHSF